MFSKEIELSPAAAPPMHLAVVDEDMNVLRSLSRTLTSCGYAVTAFQSPEAFAESLAHGPPDAVLVDLEGCGAHGISLLEQVIRDGHRIPMVFLSDDAHATASVRTIRPADVDFLGKPCDDETLLSALARAVEVAKHNHAIAPTDEELRTKWETLTPREQEVCTQLVRGRPNKQIAAELGTREKTIKVHRARVMAKMGVRSVTELARSIDRLADGSPLAS